MGCFPKWDWGEALGRIWIFILNIFGLKKSPVTREEVELREHPTQRSTGENLRGNSYQMGRNSMEQKFAKPLVHEEEGDQNVESKPVRTEPNRMVKRYYGAPLVDLPISRESYVIDEKGFVIFDAKVIENRNLGLEEEEKIDDNSTSKPSTSKTSHRVGFISSSFLDGNDIAYD